MKCNVGKADKAVRIIAGLAIGGIGIYFQSWWGLVGLVPIITSLAGFCPLYLIGGFNTCKVK